MTPKSDGVKFAVNEDKAAKWLSQIKLAIETGNLDPGASQKLAGRLTWSTQFLFHKLGRAMIKPVYAHKVAQGGVVGKWLMQALKWWLWVLQCDISQLRQVLFSSL